MMSDPISSEEMSELAFPAVAELLDQGAPLMAWRYLPDDSSPGTPWRWRWIHGVLVEEVSGPGEVHGQRCWYSETGMDTQLCGGHQLDLTRRPGRERLVWAMARAEVPSMSRPEPCLFVREGRGWTLWLDSPRSPVSWNADQLGLDPDDLRTLPDRSWLVDALALSRAGHLVLVAQVTDLVEQRDRSARAGRTGPELPGTPP